MNSQQVKRALESQAQALRGATLLKTADERLKQFIALANSANQLAGYDHAGKIIEDVVASRGEPVALADRMMLEMVRELFACQVKLREIVARARAEHDKLTADEAGAQAAAPAAAEEDHG